ncbi:MAG TPA: hypothetical protein VFD70_18920 [Anaerolineae bacterium]|nr:hypothetical protein [Anaerolineae bacterium]
MANQGSRTRGGRAWKMERASVSKKERARSKSNKYSKSDTGKKPEAGTRSRVWVGGYTREDGTKVKGYYREIGN